MKDEMKMRRYDWTTGGYDYLQAFGMSPRNAAIAGYIISLAENPCTILDAACGLCPIFPFLPEKIVSRYVAFDNSQYVQDHLPYRESAHFEFHRLTFQEFFAEAPDRPGSFDFVLYLGMYGGYHAYAERLEMLLPYAKPDGYVILEAIDDHIEDVLAVMREGHPEYKEIASCSMQVRDVFMPDITRERLRSTYVYQVSKVS